MSDRRDEMLKILEEAKREGYPPWLVWDATLDAVIRAYVDSGESYEAVAARLREIADLVEDRMPILDREFAELLARKREERSQ